MLADRRSFNLATNFADMAAAATSMQSIKRSLYRDFDDNLHKPSGRKPNLLRQRTARIAACSRSSRRTTFLNERQRRYGVPGAWQPIPPRDAAPTAIGACCVRAACCR
jgi:hypothetical protein